MKQDATVGCAQRFPKSDFTCPFADGHQHYIDDADGAKSERNHPDRAEEHIHYIENGPDHLRFLNRVPLVESAFVAAIESVVPANDSVNVRLGDLMFRSHSGLIFDERNRVLMVLAFNWECCSHHFKGNISAHVQPHVVTAAQMRHAADNFEPEAINEHK